MIEMASRSSTISNVAIVAVSSTVFSAAADLIPSSAPVLLILIAVTFGWMIVHGSWNSEIAPGSSAPSTVGSETSNLILVALTGVLVGATTAAAWMLPVFEERRFDIFDGAGYVSGFEVGAVSCIIAAAIAMVFIGIERMAVSASILGALGGMSLAIATLDSSHSAFRTFLGWSAFCALGLFPFMFGREIRRAFRDARRTPTESDSETSPNDLLSPRPTGSASTTARNDIFHHSAPFTVGEVSERSGVSTPTVRRVVRSLIEEGSLVESGVRGSGAGRRAKLYELVAVDSHDAT